MLDEKKELNNKPVLANRPRPPTALNPSNVKNSIKTHSDLLPLTDGNIVYKTPAALGSVAIAPLKGKKKHSVLIHLQASANPRWAIHLNCVIIMQWSFKCMV